MIDYICHTIECQCVLPIYGKIEKPVYHQFIVFNKIVDDILDEKYVECNNCGIIHKITKTNKSSIISDTTNYKNLVITKEDLSFNLPSNYLDFLTKKKVEEIYIWEKINFLLENNISEKVLFSKSKVENYLICEFIEVIDKNNFKLSKEKFQRDLYNEQ